MEKSEIEILIKSLRYFKIHRGATMVIKCGGEIAKDRTALDNLASDIELCTCIGIKLVLVHGGGPQATELSDRLGLKTEIIAGRRRTDDDTLEIAKMVFAGKINTDILSALHGLNTVGLSGIDGHLVIATKRPPAEIIDKASGETRLVDMGHVGDIKEVHPDILNIHLANGYIPVVASLAADDRGNPLNVNADILAGSIAEALKADKFIVLTNELGLLWERGNPSSLISYITAKRCEELIESGVVSDGMIPKIQALVHAVRNGVRRAHILDGRLAHGLLIELFTKQGNGTMITTKEEESRYEVE